MFNCSKIFLVSNRLWQLNASYNVFDAESELYLKYSDMLCCQVWHYVGSNLRKHEVVLIINNRRVYMETFGCRIQIFYVKCSVMVCCRVAHNVSSNLKKNEDALIFSNRRVSMWNPNFLCKILYHDLLAGFTRSAQNEDALTFTNRRVCM